MILIGLEEQTDIHYAMPVRNMIYDALTYSSQVREFAKEHRRKKDWKNTDEFLSGFGAEDKLIPVVTITLYLGMEDWKAPRNLYDMFRPFDLSIKSFISDYQANVIVPREIEDFSCFATGIGELLEILKSASDEADMEEVLHKNPRYRSLDNETVTMINLFANTGIEVNEKERCTDMCKAWDDHRQRGIVQGIDIGRVEGIQAAIRICRKLQSREDTMNSIRQEFSLSENQAAEYMKKFW